MLETNIVSNTNYYNCNLVDKQTKQNKKDALERMIVVLSLNNKWCVVDVRNAHQSILG